MGTKKKKSKSTIRAMQKREWTQDPTQPGEQTEFLYAVRNDDQAFYVRRTAKPRNLTDGEKGYTPRYGWWYMECGDSL